MPEAGKEASCWIERVRKGWGVDGLEGEGEVPMGLGSNWTWLLAAGLPALDPVGGASVERRVHFVLVSGRKGGPAFCFTGPPGRFIVGAPHPDSILSGRSARRAPCTALRGVGSVGRKTHEKRVLEAQQVHRILTSASAQNTQALHGSGALATAASASRAC